MRSTRDNVHLLFSVILRTHCTTIPQSYQTFYHHDTNDTIHHTDGVRNARPHAGMRGGKIHVWNIARQLDHKFLSVLRLLPEYLQEEEQTIVNIQMLRNIYKRNEKLKMKSSVHMFNEHSNVYKLCTF